MKPGIISLRGISFALIVLFFLCTGCGTGRNTALTRAYHELTTRYNVFYNAEQAYQEILEEQSRNFTDSYDSLLPLYPRVILEEKQLPGGPFDGVVEKASKAIREHSVTAKPRRDPTKRVTADKHQWLQQDEFNPFLHNAWILLGKAHLQNGDLEMALATFSHINRIYRHDEKVVQEATILMMRCYTEQNRLYQAEQSARVLLTTNLPDNLQPLFDETYTDYLLKKGDYNASIPWLKRVISNEKVQSQKRRLSYLLGQLLQLTGEREAAYQAFDDVKGLSTPFDLQLQATMSQYTLALQSKQPKLKRALEKMRTAANEAQLTRIEETLESMNPTAIGDSSLLVETSQTALEVGDSLLIVAALHDSLYQKAYHAFMKGDTTMVKTVATQFIDQFPESAWLSQMKQMQDIIQSKRMPIDSPPGTAWESLTERNNSRGAQNEPLFIEDPLASHQFLLVYEKPAADRNMLLFSTAAFNFSRFRLRTHDLTFLPLGAREALVISTFHSYDDAYQYGVMLLSDSLFTATVHREVIPLVISKENSDRLRRNGRMDDYLAFEKSYLTSKLLPSLSLKVEEVNDISREEQQKKIVPLETDQSLFGQTEDSMALPGRRTERLSPTELLQKLEEVSREAMKRSQEQTDPKSREKELKEREKLREERIRQREKELKERARKREEMLRKREKERDKKIRKR